MRSFCYELAVNVQELQIGGVRPRLRVLQKVCAESPLNGRLCLKR